MKSNLICIVGVLLLLAVCFFTNLGRGETNCDVAVEKEASVTEVDSLRKLTGWYKEQLRKAEHAAFIVVSKEELTLRLYDYAGRQLAEYPVACGAARGNKESKLDGRTPEGVFRICNIERSAGWKHDFRDGKGAIAGAYGPYFLRLEVPRYRSIGIHGTHLPESVGTRATEGCIRLRNEDLLSLLPKVYVGMVVVITPSVADLRGK